MAAPADGYIRINTKIDQTGVDKGMATLTRSLKGFAAAVGVAFGVGAVVSFSKACLDVASDLTEVQNVIDVTFGGSVGLIEQFASTAATSFGLSELAAKRYTGTMGAMLKSMGFLEGAAASMSIKLAQLTGDMASFYNLETDEAFDKIRSGISGETEPLKQLGINLSVANLQQYALSQGITSTYDALSEQSKALLRYNYLLDVTADAQGDFVRTSDSWSNQVRILKLQWESLQATLGKAFIAVLTPTLQTVNNLVGSLNNAAYAFANFVAAVTGQTQQVAAGAEKAAAAVDNLTDSTDATGEAAETTKKSLAGFDELNQLSGSSTSATDLEAAAAAAASIQDSSEEIDNQAEKIQQQLTNFMMPFADQIMIIEDQWTQLKGLVSDFFSMLKRQSEEADFGSAAFDAALGAIYAIQAAARLAIQAVEDIAGAFDIPATVTAALQYAADGLQAVGDAIMALTPGVTAFIQEGIQPFAEWVGIKLRDIFQFFAEQLEIVGDWFTDNKDLFREIGERLGRILNLSLQVVEALIDSKWNSAKETIAIIVLVVLGLAEALL
jgi:hypothetical protein